MRKNLLPTVRTDNYYACLADDERPLETTHNTGTTLTTKPIEAVLDSGATHTFFPATYKTNKERINQQGEGILVSCARDRVNLKSFATDEAK